MEWILAKLIAWPIIGPFIKMVGGFFLDWHKQNLDAQGAHEVQVSTVVAKAIELDKREAELNSALLIAEQGNWFTRSVRPTMGWIVIIVLAKVLIWDKALGQWTGGHTDGLDPNLWWVMQTIIIGYYGGRSAEKVADKIAGIWKK